MPGAYLDQGILCNQISSITANPFTGGFNKVRLVFDESAAGPGGVHPRRKGKHVRSPEVTGHVVIVLPGLVTMLVVVVR